MKNGKSNRLNVTPPDRKRRNFPFLRFLLTLPCSCDSRFCDKLRFCGNRMKQQHPDERLLSAVGISHRSRFQNSHSAFPTFSNSKLKGIHYE
jgi:hypothetical protein